VRVAIDFREITPKNATYKYFKDFSFDNVPDDVSQEFMTTLGPMYIGGKSLWVLPEIICSAW
jgi:hypothetical protein